MKSSIKLLSSILMLLFSASAYSKPFISVSSIDSSGYPVMNVTLSVKNSGSTMISDLSAENISIYEDGYRVSYLQVKRESLSDSEIYIVMSLDSSRSIKDDFLTKARSSVADLVSIGREWRIALYRFDDKAEFLNSFTSSREELVKALSSVKRRGKKTLLYDSLYECVSLLEKTDSANKTIIVYTDGKDEGSSVRADDVIKAAYNASISLYFVRPSSLKEKNVANIARMAKLTHGAISTEKDSVVQLYRRVSSRMESVYSVKYPTLLKRDGERHVLEVRMKYDSVSDRESREFTLSGGAVTIFGVKLLHIFLAILAAAASVGGGYLFYIISKKMKDRRESDVEELFTSSERPYIETSAASHDLAVTAVRSEEYCSAWLIYKDGESGQKFPLVQEEMTLGRSKECSIIVEDRAVTAKHSKIKNVDGCFYLFDLASDTGTFLNGKKLLRPKQLYDWDEIQLGHTLFIFRGSKVK